VAADSSNFLSPKKIKGRGRKKRKRKEDMRDEEERREERGMRLPVKLV